jgi:hypothetical protein
MTLITRELKQLLYPNSLKETLEVLLQRGDITYYRIGVSTTTIRAAKGAEILLLLKEESKPRPNPRPYVANKSLTRKK